MTITRLVLFFDAVAYIIATTFFDINTVLPSFIYSVSHSEMWIGLAYAIKQIGFVLPQLFMMTKVHHLPSPVRFIWRVMLFDRPQWLFFLLMLTAGVGREPTLFSFFFCFTLFSIGEGIIQVPWMDLFGRSVETDRRGRLFGWIHVAGNTGALVAGYIISKAIPDADHGLPADYLPVFTVGYLLLLPSLLFFLQARDRAPQHPIYRPSPYSSQSQTGFARLPSPRLFNSRSPVRSSSSPPPALTAVVSIGTWFRHCLGNRNFLYLTFCQYALSLSLLVSPYYLIAQLEKPHVDLSMGDMIFYSIAGSAAGALLFGYLGDKKGNRSAMITASALALFCPLLFVLCDIITSHERLQSLLVAAFTLQGIASSGSLSFFNYLLEMSGDRERPHFVAINSLLQLPVALLPLAGTMLRDHMGDTLTRLVVSLSAIFGLLLALYLRDARQPS
ncbi:MFS transporter [Heliobacillus mobilis]|uniref:MFS transporter n=1 Tax=Heliobacterium mobile TaxID=28064 RepID=A0A6I3SKA2_HELMO|nr:MFS transporter [Heliobacterium mobile]MTV48977.1 MFS transporter [Heliobacterium mobile]